MKKTNEDNVLQDLIHLEKKDRCAWRFQPRGKRLSRHGSFDYSGDERLPRGTVWAFANLTAALADIHDRYEPGASYARTLEQEGNVPELVAVCDAREEDGPEGFVLAHGGKIKRRFDVKTLRKNKAIIRWLKEQDWW